MVEITIQDAYRAALSVVKENIKRQGGIVRRTTTDRSTTRAINLRKLRVQAAVYAELHRAAKTHGVNP